MKNIVIEPGRPSDSNPLRFILARRFNENREFWSYFDDAFSVTNVDATVERVLACEPGDNLIIEKMSDKFDVWDKMIALLYTLKARNVKLNIYVMDDRFLVILDKYFASEKYEIMDFRFAEVMKFHNIYKLGLDNEHDQKVNFAYSDDLGGVVRYMPPTISLVSNSK